jgi:hypothetical protein
MIAAGVKCKEANSPMFARLLLVIACVTAPFGYARGATIELTGTTSPVTGKQTPSGIKIEGAIEPGDAIKLLRTYEYYGEFRGGLIFLFSRGGDIKEAMKIGRLIRQLRLATYAPDRASHEILALPADKANNVCASACVLVWVAGARRTGDLLILHRPYPAPESADKLSDIEFEALENNAISRVRNYLQEMDLPQYYIDKMVLTASRDGYMPTTEDLTEHPLPEFAASIEELILSKCETVGSLALKDYLDYFSRHKFNSSISKNMLARMDEADACEEERLAELRIAAWIRESISKVNGGCSANAPSVTSEQPWRSTTEPSNAKDWPGKPLNTPSTQKETSAPDAMFYWREQMELELDPHSTIDDSELGYCQKQALRQIAFETLDRLRHAKLGDAPPPEFSVDTSILGP